MNKLFIVILVTILISVFVSALVGQITSFDGQSNPFTIDFQSNVIQVYNLSLPMWGEINNTQIVISNYDYADTLFNTTIYNYSEALSIFRGLAYSFPSIYTASDGGVMVFNVSNIGNYTRHYSSLSFHSSYLNQGLLYAGFTKIVVYNATTMENIQNVSSTDGANNIYSIWIDDELLLAGTDSNLRFLNISDNYSSFKNLTAENDYNGIITNDDYIIFGTDEPLVMVLNRTTYENILNISGFDIKVLTSNKDDTYFYLGDNDGVKIYEKEGLVSYFNISLGTVIYRIYGDDNYLAVGTSGGVVNLYDKINYSLIQTFASGAGGGNVWGLFFNDELLIEANSAKGISYWNRTADIGIPNILKINISDTQLDEINLNDTSIYPLNITSSFLNDILKGGCNCSGCVISSQMCILNYYFNSRYNSSIDFNITILNYTYGIDNCSTFTYPVINFTYLDQLNGSPIIAQNAYDLVLTSPFTQTLQDSFGESSYNHFCSAVNNTVNYTITGDITLTANKYGTQIFDYSVGNALYGLNTPLATYNLYLAKLENTSTVVYTWRTNTFENVDGTMEIYTCDGDGNRNLVASQSIIDGETSANIELLNTPYSYEVIYNGIRYSDFDSYSKCHIETQTTRLYIIKVGEDIAPVSGLYSIPCNLTRTGNFSFILQWGVNPQSSEQIMGCVEAYRQSVRGSTLISNPCSNTTGLTGSVADSGFTYLIKARLYQNGLSIGCEDILVFETADERDDTFGITGILAVFFLIAGAILLFAHETPKWYPIMGVVGVILAWLLGILAFGWIAISSLVAFAVIIIIIGRHGKKQ